MTIEEKTLIDNQIGKSIANIFGYITFNREAKKHIKQISKPDPNSAIYSDGKKAVQVTRKNISPLPIGKGIYHFKMVDPKDYL